MHKPETIVELGTGLAISALWMALAMRENGSGHMWTVDNFEWFNRRPERAAGIIAELRSSDILDVVDPSAAGFYSALGHRLRLSSVLTFVKGQIQLNERNHFDLYSFHGRPIDLLFSDFKHGGLRFSLCLVIFCLDSRLPPRLLSTQLLRRGLPTSCSNSSFLNLIGDRFQKHYRIWLLWIFVHISTTGGLL